MRTENIKNHLAVVAASSAFVLTIGLSACTDPNEGSLFVTPTTEESEMATTDILERDADKFSLWIALLHHANYYNALKDGSARATVMCPNNDAMQRFLREQGVSTVDQLPVDYARSVVRVHIINNKQYTDTQIEDYANMGRDYVERGYEVPDTTLLGTNLTVRYGYIETNVDDAQRHDDQLRAEDSIFINNQARLAPINTVTTCANATLFTLDDVIHPLVETIMDKLDAEPEVYSIFASAVRECGYDSVANLTTSVSYTLTGTVVTNYNFTCLAVPNSVYQAAGINDVASLRNYLAAHCEGADAMLENYVKYHFLPRSYLKEELLSYESDEPEADDETLIYDTQFKGQAITVSRKNGVDLLNEKVELVRTNIKARNGLIYRIGDVMPVYHPKPVRVVWDFLNSPDIISFVNGYGAANNLGNIFSTPLDNTMRDVDLSDDHFDGNYGTITSFTYQAQESKARTNTYRRVGYKKDAVGTGAGGSQYGAYMNNFLILNLGFTGWIKFTTPTIIAGKYKVVLHYCKDINHNNFTNSGSLVRFDLDDYNTMAYLYKGMPRLPRYQLGETTIIGSITFEGSGSHSFKMTMQDVEAKNNSNYHLSLDYLEFVPID